MKKILFVVESFGGGVFTYLSELSNGLCEYFELYIAYSKRPQTPLNFNVYFDRRIHLKELKNFRRSISPLQDLKAIFELRKITSEINPDIIHLHSSKAGVVGRIAFNGKTVPLFYTPHGYSFLMENYGFFKRSFFKLIEKVMAMRNCTTISCSLGEHMESLGLTKKASYVNNGINTVELDKIIEKVERVKHPFTVYTLGRICFQKNPSLFNKIAESMPSVNFLWIGDGELRNELKSKNIKVTGWVDREKAIHLCLNADVFILTSLWEGLPISLLESMYMKKLCIVNNVIGNRDVILNGVNGFVCSSVMEFKNAIETKKTDCMISRAFDDINNTYNTKIMVDRYKVIYNECLVKKYN